MTMLTALEIAGNLQDIVATHAGPDGNGKYKGWITRGVGHNFKPLLSSNFEFDTIEAADAAMRKVIQDVVVWRKELGESIKRNKRGRTHPGNRSKNKIRR